MVSLDGVATSQMVSVSASVNLHSHHKVQKFSSGTGSPGWSWKKGRKTVVVVEFIAFCVSRRRCKMYCGHARLCVCLSVRGRTPTLLHGPGCNLGAWFRLPPSCALWGGFAIGARVALL